jgi:hypothetical protein
MLREFFGASDRTTVHARLRVVHGILRSMTLLLVAHGVWQALLIAQSCARR